jgi:hypothetical protein
MRYAVKTVDHLRETPYVLSGQSTVPPNPQAINLPRGAKKFLAYAAAGTSSG